MEITVEQIAALIKDPVSAFILSFAVTLATLALSGFLSVTLFTRQQRPVRIVWLSKTTVMLDARRAREYPGFTLKYGDVSVHKVYRTRIAFWNGRERAVQPADFATANPLRVEIAGDGVLLDTPIVVISTKAEAKLMFQPGARDSAQVDFEFLSQSDGAIVEVLHDGGTARLVGLAKDGSVKGKNAGVEFEQWDRPGNLLGAIVSLSWRWAKEPLRGYIRLAMTFAGLVLVGWVLATVLGAYATSRESNSLSQDGFDISLFMFVVLPALVYFRAVHEFWSSWRSVPSKLRAFYQEL